MKDADKAKEAPLAERVRRGQTNLWILLVGIILVTLVGMTAFEAAKQVFWPDISIWESPVVTIFFSSFIAAMGGFWALRRMRLLHQGKHPDVTRHEQIEEALRLSEARYRLLVETVPHGIQENDTSGIITFSNTAHAAMHGYAKGELVGTAIWDSLPSEAEKDKLRAYLAHLVKEQPPPTPYISKDRAKDGRLIDVEVDWNYKRDDQGHLIGFVSVITDITERKKAERTLHESEARSRALVRAIPDALFRLDRDGVYLDFIPAEGFETLQPPDVFLGKPVHEILPADLAEQTMFHIHEALEHNEPQCFEYTLLINDEQRYYEGRIVPDEDVTVLAIVRDISAQKQAQKAHQESEDRLNEAQRLALIGSWEFDLYTETLTWSEEMYSLHGTTPEAFTGDLWQLGYATLHPDDRDATIASIERTQAEGGTSEVEFRLVQPDGAVRTMRGRARRLEDASGRPVRLVGTMQDITERKQAERALRESEEKFSRAFRASPDAITISRLHDGLFLEVNDGFERLFGYRREEVLGKTATALQIWQADDRARLIEPLRRGDVVRDLEANIVMKTGEVRDCLISADMIALKGESCLVAITRDVSARKQVERERVHLIEELEAKNVELEQFTYTVSHDLKSPLFTIKGFLGILEQDLGRGNVKKVGQDIEHIRTAADKMQQLLNELLELSRVGRMVNSPEAVSLTDLAHEAAEQVAGQIAERGVEIDIAPAMPEIVGDRVRLLQVMQNLIDNAVKYMGTQATPRIVIRGARETDQVVCFVRDNGMGIAPRHQEKVFGLFERLDARSEGTGLGLALAKRIIEVHGGRIWVESKGEDQGSTFYFTFPLPKD